jgi:malate dehydrogenase
MVVSILKDSKKIYTCATLLNGEYGYKDVVNGVPVMLGRNGVEKIIEVSLNETEKAQFKKSVDSVQELIEVLRKKDFIKD